MGSGKDAIWLKKEIQKLVNENRFDDAREMVMDYQNLPKVNIDLLRLRILKAEETVLLDKLGITL
jgi:hypothetical protein